MRTKGRGFLLAAGILGAILVGAAPVLAQSHGGGGHGGGGGGHGGGGGEGHGGGGGGHVSGGGFSAGGHVSSGGHFGGGGSPHYAAGDHVAGGGIHGYSGTGYNNARGYGGAGYAARGRGYGGAGYYAPRSYGGGFHGSAYAGHSTYYGHSSGYYAHRYGYSTGAYWAGGYWNGAFWPRCHYGVAFTWFLPILPVTYATYWYSGIPYYYANDVYYTYNTDYDGYVATDPPPVADSGAAPAAGTPDDAGAADQIFMYPKHGQSAEQQATDKAECQQWATEQAGQAAQNGSDYRRAMIACVEGRGYSAK
jgi:hypothetical protein